MPSALVFAGLQSTWLQKSFSGETMENNATGGLSAV